MITSSSYIVWAKSRPAATYDLAGSNLLACSIDDLPGARDALALVGPNENGYEPLVGAVARHYGVTPDRVSLAPGTTGANFFVFAALLGPGDEVLVERPGYDPLAGAPQVVGARVRRFDRLYEDGYAIDPTRIEAALTPRTKLIVITDPHNPSGVRAAPDALAAIGRLAAGVGARVLVDEVYLDAGFDEPRTPAATRSDAFISTSSLTKSYGLNALRCGWAVAPPEVAERVRRSRDLVDGIGSIVTERLAAIAFAHLDRLAARAHAIVAPNRALVREFVESRRELEWVRPRAATVAFPRLRGVADAGPFVDRLFAEHGTAVVPGRFFEAPAHFRIAFAGSRDGLVGGLTEIGRALDGMGGQG